MQKILIFLAAVFAWFSAAAVTVECSPGELAALLPAAATESSLTVTGRLDASDLVFISEKMPRLASLDLADATIVEYQGFALNGYRHYQAGEIPAGMFAGTGLTTVTLPRQGVTLGDAAFAGSALQAVSLPGNVSLGCGVFAACHSLAAADIATESLPEATFSDCTALATVSISGDCSVGERAFANCTALAIVSGSDHISTIGEAAFAGCTALRGFVFGSGLTAIGPEAFALSGLTAADLSRCSRLQNIGSWAFARCNALASAAMPPNITRYGDGLFFDCPALADLTASAAATAVGDYAFKGSEALPARTVFTEDIDSVGAYSLAGNKATTSLELPSGLSYIGDHAMEGMSSLRDIQAQSLRAVPALGSEVWAGIDQPAVTLYTGADRLEDFANADQWREFNIVAYDSRLDSTGSDPASVSGRFAGNELQLDFGGNTARLVELYNTHGMRLLQSNPGQVPAVSIDTSDLADNIYLVVVTLDDNTRTALKLAR